MPLSQKGLAKRIARLGPIDDRIVAAFEAVDRADFVPPRERARAYDDRPIQIPEGQTTSQPSLIAYMIQAALPEPTDAVLEVGTGYGFQTALLAQLAGRVVSIDRWPSLVEAARNNLERAGIHDAVVLVGDGWKGCPEEGPFDVIIVSAAASSVPAAFVEQMKEGARLVIPVASGASDDVLLYRKSGGRLERVRLVSPARFVPLVQEGTS
jgi:protein-L-isoaspartate(D-aspartate) O-methyltransferase